jgi:ABC-type transporter Mla maintaining outer membrane lipid asymmetry permease subunit MlaE
MTAMADHLLLTLTPIDLAYTAIKSFAFGWIIAVVCAHHGLQGPGTNARVLPQTLSKAVMQSLMVMTLFNAAFGYFVYGVLLFGIIRAEN